ncbi:MAG: secretin N-terminal domain-containing protein [Planctomycetota bacterium]
MIRIRQLALIIAASCFLARPAAAQQAMMQITGPNGQTMMVPAGANPFGGQPPAGAQPPGGAKAKPGKGDGDAKKPDDKKGKSEDPEPRVIRRGDQKFDDADPDELKARLADDGRVEFEFKNQSWVALIEWLAEISGRPLDWQELPPDRVNIRAPGRYTVAETMDLFNRHLLARGYTILDLAGGLTVVKTEGINPAMVPRVTVSELQRLTPHTFVRTSLELGWLSSTKLAEELKPMISANGKLTALTTTNRIEAMDAAVNLRQIAELLEQERDPTSREALAPEFKLRYISAENAKVLLEQFLGVQEKKQAVMTPQQMQMMQQMAQQGGRAPGGQQKKTEISIVANTRQNSVFVRAPADRIAIAREFIKRIDVPSDDIVSLADVESRVQIYRLYSIDPEKLVEIIKDMNILEPSTRVRANEDDGTLFVSGSAADRFIIEKLIKRLDSSGRQFEVLQLRRLNANDVAESITFLMGKDKEEEDNNRSRGYFFYGYGRQEEKKEKDEFRVAANARFQQVLLWANETEMEQVRNLLIKLGELPPPGGSTRMVRRIQASSSPETFEYLQRLKRQWEQVSDSPLMLPDASEFVDPVVNVDSDEDAVGSDALMSTPKDDATEAEEAEAEVNTTTQVPASQSTFVTTPQLEENEEAADSPPPVTSKTQIRSAEDFDRMFGSKPKAETPKRASENDGAPIQIGLDENGNLVLSGKDTKALDQLENMMLRVRPPRRPYHVFHIKHQSAGYVRLNLVEYFEEEEDESEADRFYRFWFDEQPTDDGPGGLGESNELRFVYDPDTNTIVVTGATSSQLKTIGELIELWDVPEPVNKRRMRYIKLVSLEYGRAAQIAETVKEACRDLLSSNDKAFAQGRGGGGGGNPGNGGNGGGEKSSGRESRGSGLAGSENGKDGGDIDFSFKGKLSIGIDTTGNTLLLSAEGEPLLDLVEGMILELDQAAKPAGDLRILSLSGKTSSESIGNILRAFGGKPGAASGAAVAKPKPNGAIPGATPRG